MDAIYYTLLFPDRPLRIEFKPRFWVAIFSENKKILNQILRYVMCEEKNSKFQKKNTYSRGIK